MKTTYLLGITPERHSRDEISHMSQDVVLRYVSLRNPIITSSRWPFRDIRWQMHMLTGFHHRRPWLSAQQLQKHINIQLNYNWAW